MPGGRIQAGAGTGRKVTLFNCFVMGEIQDSIISICENIKEGTLTMQWGGGICYRVIRICLPLVATATTR